MHVLADLSVILFQPGSQNRFNTAAISAKRASFGSPNGGDDDTNTGGLVGYTNSSELTDCYNSGTIMKSDQSENVGGIIGYLGVSYSFTSGKTDRDDQYQQYQELL